MYYHLNRSRFIFLFLLFVLQISCSSEPVEPVRRFSKLQEVPFQLVKIDDPFWNERILTVQSKTIPDLLKMAREGGWIDNFLIIAGKKQGKITLKNSPDSDLYKILEAASYSLVWKRDQGLERELDDIIAIIASAQDKDGYLNTQYQLPFGHPASPERDNPRVKRYGYGPEQRWKATVPEWPKGMGQLYCAGHLFEAAAAHFRATGKKTLLEVAVRLADCMDKQLDRKNFNYADHPQVEIGLVKLYQVTGERRYLELADFIAHNSHFQRPPDIGDGENKKPIAEQKNAFGHCVRTMYLYSGFTDLVSYKGNQKDMTGLSNLWESVAGKKMYVHGGIGNGTAFEQHGLDYELPNDRAYCECCGSIAMGQWNHRLNLVTGNAKYADLVEIEAYNSALSGLSLDGTKYFYRNVLTANSKNNQWSQDRWRYLFCCPSKLPGFITGLSRWIYALDDETIYANLFVGNTARIPFGKDTIVIKQETGYPWKGDVSFKFEPVKSSDFTFAIRVPGWTKKVPVPGGLYNYSDNYSANISVIINGQPVTDPKVSDGYLRLTRKWNPGDKVSLRFEMPVRKVITVPEVKDDAGYSAVMRGPIVYCLESIDNSGNIFDFTLSDDASLAPDSTDSLLPGTFALKGLGQIRDSINTPVRLIPYFLWDNRGKSDMTVWIPRKWTKEIAERQAKSSKISNKKGNTDG